MRLALRGSLQPGLLDDFLATVDWSNQDRAPKPIREALGMLEQVATEFAEDELSEAEYEEKLEGIFRAGDRLQAARAD